ncbi:MAG: sodium:proton antiporter [Bacteroidetes bacterium GWF2_42_66]|nr:MAG: sodium:proton antiporter [Bacteroidetes bacterium GWA2_42_15]OFY03544.1 MAG: sodium:proton antiporter [Bacteroidetes bacterium GWE2_42_39]OFY45909.1 MAG: sodium:proton antiporter [Bacteroidetes bacterium GWF2_42_66]HBL75151.1 sodium:proton antiporter [Prolixibacteraceae bacterium]HCU59611.1 sodium:proton antiporter [Prolixibacteraceae bacterium]
MFILMVVIFVLGYLAIALEHPLKVDKAASALIIGTLCWVAYIIGAEEILQMGLSPAWAKFTAANPDAHGIHAIREFIVESEIIHHIGEIGEILFFLLGAMTIVEVVDQHEGFKVITDRIRTTNKVKLLWVVSFLTFFMSALLDNLTTTIVMVALLRKLIDDRPTRWFFASMVVLAANAGGAWSPIGDVTTIMLWIGGQVTTLKIIEGVFLPSLVCMVVPLAVLSFTMKGNVTRPIVSENEEEITTAKERLLMLVLGVSGLLFVPVFKTITHLPPFMGMLLSLGVIWVISEIMHKDKPSNIKKQLKVIEILRRVDVPTVLFFLGILSAVAALQSAGHLSLLSQYLDEKLHNIFLIDIAIGVLSSVVDNVPLVAGAMGMYPIAEMGVDPYLNNFVQDGLFWEFLAYTAGTGGSMLIIGSAAGVAAMGLEKIDFIWYLKKISWLALIGYLAGAAVYFIMFGL